jgi:hypothetical protein
MQPSICRNTLNIDLTLNTYPFAFWVVEALAHAGPSVDTP